MLRKQWRRKYSRRKGAFFYNHRKSLYCCIFCALAIFGGLQFFWLQMLLGKDEHLCNMPSFFLLGFQDTGVDDIYLFLTEQENLSAPPRRNSYFFDVYYNEGVQWLCDYSGGKSLHHTFDATDSYIYEKEVPFRIQSMIPQAKFIIVLEDPVIRGLRLFKKEGVDELEKQMKFGCSDIGEVDPTQYPLLIGCYFTLLTPWIDKFSSNHFTFVFTHSFFNNITGTTADISNFLEVPLSSPSVPLTRPEVDIFDYPDQMAMLRHFYKKDTRLLRDYLGEIDRTQVIKRFWI